MDKTSSKPTITAQTESPKSTKPQRSWRAWLAILLVPIIFCLPLWGEELQLQLIGYEGWCCHPDNWQELEQAAQRARSMRLDSNIILGTGVTLAVIVFVIMLFILYKYAIPCLARKKLRRLAQILVGLFVAPLALLLVLTIILLIFHNDDFHKTRYQPPRDSIYAHAIDLISY